MCSTWDAFVVAGLGYQARTLANVLSMRPGPARVGGACDGEVRWVATKGTRPASVAVAGLHPIASNDHQVLVEVSGVARRPSLLDVYAGVPGRLVSRPCFDMPREPRMLAKGLSLTMSLHPSPRRVCQLPSTQLHTNRLTPGEVRVACSGVTTTRFGFE